VPPSLGRVTPVSLSSLGAKDLGQSVSDWGSPLVTVRHRLQDVDDLPHSTLHGIGRQKDPARGVARHGCPSKVDNWPWPSNGFPTKGRLAAGPFQILLSRVPDV